MKILWLKTELLHPVDKGGKIRTYQMLKELKKEHEITYLSLDDGSADPDALEKASEYCTSVETIPHKVAAKFSGKFYFELAANAASRLPYALQKYVSAGMREAITRIVDRHEHDVLVCDFLAPAVNVPEDLNIPTVLFQHNVEAMIWRRHFEVSSNAVKRAFLKNQYQRMFEYEKLACRGFDRVVAVSREDVDTIRADYQIDRIDDIPTGVDVDYFEPNRFPPKTGNKVVFTGSMDWLPNDDAITWFAESIWPSVRGQVNDASLVIVGRDPSPSIKDLSRRDASINVTGRVPDVRPYMADARVFIVPIRVGGGTRLKIYEAMAMGLPVVSTTIGAEGLPLKNDEEIVLRNDAADFAAAVVDLLQDQVSADAIGRSAGRKVRQNYGWATVARAFAEQCRVAVQGADQMEDTAAAISASTAAAAG